MSLHAYNPETHPLNPANAVIEQLQARIEHLQRAYASLFDAIKHGDERHQTWLREAIDAHFDGRPVPPATGSDEKTRLRDALRKCAWQFRFYAEEHEAKGATEKAAKNREFAQMASDALAQPTH